MNRAEAGGISEYGRDYKGGEFMPFYVPRAYMPQVGADDLAWLISDAVRGGQRVTVDVVPVASLRAHQRIDHNKAITMPPEVKLKPVIVSDDGYIVDGNHRWWSHVHAKDDLICVIRLGKSFDNAVAWALQLPYVYEITSTTPIRD